MTLSPSRIFGSMGQLGANAKGATAAVPWYLSGGVSAANCLAAYKPKGAVSLAASYDNIAAPGNGLADGTYDAAPGAAPDWSAAKGWFFTGGTKWLTTGITFLEGWTFLGRYYQGAANQFFCGAYSAPRGIAYALTTTQRQYWSGTYFYTLGVSPKGVAGVAGNLGYFNGLLDTTPMAAWGATIPVVFTIGRMGNFASAWWTGGCSAFAIYNTALTAPQILAISTAMQNIDNTTMVAFGDSITAGLNASDAAHRWANIVATTTGYTLVNAGAASTTLQNTVQNTVAVLGAAASGNGRDTYVARVCANYPGRVYILYGLNDLRLDDAANAKTAPDAASKHYKFLLVNGGQVEQSDGRYYALVDGVVEPDTVAGVAWLYVDQDDGDLKVKFGDGTVKVLSADT